MLRAQIDQPVGWVHEAQKVARNFFDEVGMGRLGPQQGDVPFQLGPHGFETLYLELEEACTLDQLRASLEAVAALVGMEGEIGGQSQAGKHNKSLPHETRKPGSPVIGKVTRHCFTHAQDVFD